jgi:predicted secreted protein
MTAFLLKTRYFDAYTTVAGLRVHSESITPHSIDIIASGIFTGSVAEHEIRGHALNDDVVDVELSFDHGQRLRAKAKFPSIEYTGDFNGERNYQIHIQSTSEVEMIQ